MREGLQITDAAVNDEKFIHKYQSAVGSLQFLVNPRDKMIDRK